MEMNPIYDKQFLDLATLQTCQVIFKKCSKILERLYYIYHGKTCMKCYVVLSYFIIFSESKGQLEAEEGTYTSHITQTEIKKAVDITSAAKSFDLNLDQFGPYK